MGIQQSGYNTTAQTVAWASGQALASLTDNEFTDESDAIDNSTNKYLFADIEIVLGSAAFTGADSSIEIYIIPSLDGTNYADWAGNTTTDQQENNQYKVASVITSGATAAQRLIARGVSLPPGLYKFAFRNRSNVSLAASGNTAKWRPYGYENV